MIHHLHQQQRVPVPLDRAFAFFADAGNLERITPPALRFQIMTPMPIDMREGALIAYRLRLRGIPFAWLTRIDAWEPPHHFVDRQLRGPYRRWVHTHRFRACDGGTEIEDHVEYGLPIPPLGELARSLVRRELDGIFGYRRAQIEELLR